jgi:hypothetical protein
VSAGVYRDQVWAALPRLLALFDVDPASPSYGMGDRRHWAWGLSDFANGTFQGAANGLARLVQGDLLPPGVAAAPVLRRIEAMFDAADRIRRRDGSLEEAFPWEGSYCVTALGAYDLLTALELVGDRWPVRRRQAMLAVVAPMILFLVRSDDTHALISNHLATAVAAFAKWKKLTGDGPTRDRGEELLARILDHQSDEGWYCEYGGADPGYQSLCTYYLADVLRLTGDERLERSLAASVGFIRHFAHPDGSFGGLYGSRNTRFFYPGGFEYLAGRMPQAAALAAAMRPAIAEQKVVTLASMDEPNLVPMFNAYCWAAAIAAELPEGEKLPCRAPPFRRHWPEAGLLVDRGAGHYTIVGTRKGGIVYHFEGGKPAIVDPGLVYRGPGDRRYSTQSLADRETVTFEGDEIVVESDFHPVTKRLPKPWQFVLLRLLNLSVMRNMALREWMKRRLVRMLITGAGSGAGTNRRRIRLGERLAIEDDADVPKGWEPIPIGAAFTAIHMASQGYWQVQDDR